MNDIDKIVTDCIILGGGVGGLTCAQELAIRGYDSAVVEKAPFLGGHAAKLVCKATTRCQNCGACLVGDVVRQTEGLPQIGKMLSARVETLRRDSSIFVSLVVQSPVRIVPDQCIECGECVASCPSPGAIRLSPFIGKPYIMPEACLRYQGGICAACAEVCRSSAIHISATETSLQVESEALVVATGFTPFNPKQKPRLGYGQIPGVLTALELEELLRNEQLEWNPKGRPINRIAFIQCVGSRDAHIGHNYCSQVCCAYALRMARLLKTKQPEVNITVFYMDIQTFERDFATRLKEADEEVNLCRAIPSEARTGKEGGVELLYHSALGYNVWESFDLVVLSIGMSPPDSIPALNFVARDSDGFFDASEQKGIFVVGACQGPKSIIETIRHAENVAEKIALYLK